MKHFLRNILFTAGTVALVAAAALPLYARFALPDVSELATVNPTTSTFMAHSLGEPLQQWVAYDRIPEVMKRGVLVAEDPRFFEHSGIDWRVVWLSMLRNIKKQRIELGASSVTMQLAKNLYLSPRRSVVRKFDQLLIAFKLERALSKERILELYLNLAEWGPRVYGVGMAARYYFSKPVDQLTTREAAYLAAILPNPKLVRSRYYQTKFTLISQFIYRQLVLEGFPK